MMELFYLIVIDMFWSSIAATGFAFLFNVQRRLLPWCALLGAIGHGLRTVMISQDISIEASTFISACLLGLLADFLSHRVHAPTTILTVPAVIPMIPGTFAYRTMLGILNLTQVGESQAREILLDVNIFAIRTGIIIGGLAIGIALPHLLRRQ